ncbi:MAG: hypothetical protein JO305_06010 [Alphaproteobacteria bacterium]|nr:hypothetical protein [Alphaproteobacteria bacterium]
MRWTFVVAAALLAAALALPGLAAPQSETTGTPDMAAATDAAITFDQYKDWRLHQIERRRVQLADSLAAADLTAARKDRLQQQKAYYDWLAAMSEEDRDRRFRDRFNEIDTNHDGRIDAAERAAWRDKQRDYYRQHAAARSGKPQP